MSWFSTNYDKALLGGGGLIALGMLYFGWSQVKASAKDFDKDPRGRGGTSEAVEGAEKIAQTMQSMELDHGITQAITEEGRAVDSMTGIPLFIKRETNSQPIDLLKGAMVHPPIENSFWLDNDIDPGFADSPLRDPDADGFTNLEEFKEGTDPNDANSHPEPLKKLRYIKDDSIAWRLKPGFLAQGNAVPITYEDGKRQKNKAGAGAPVKPGELFFQAGAAQGRFKYVGHIVKQENNPALNMLVNITLVEIEDQKPNKAGKIYQIPAPLKIGDLSKFTQYDRSAVLELEALGQEGNNLVIEENTRFSLPAGQEEKPYLLKSVTPAQIIVEFVDAEGNTREIPVKKGAMPAL